MMTNQYKNYLRRLQEIVGLEVVPKTAIFDYFTSHIYKEDEAPEEVEPLIWYLQSALLTDLTFTIYRLYDRGADRNIYHFVEFADQNKSKIEWLKPLERSDYEKQRELLSSIENITDTLKKRRNKYFAHYDKKYFYDPDQIEAELPFSNNNAKHLVRVAQGILNQHSHALDGTGKISIDGFAYVAADNLYQKLKNAYRSAKAT